MRARALALGLLAAGCASKSGSLLVVTVESVPSGAAIASVHAHVVTTARPGDFDVSFPANSTTPVTFGIDFPPEIGGDVTVQLDSALGAGSGTTPIVPGGTAMMTVTLGGGAPVDFAGVDLTGVDLATPPVDFAGGADFAHVPVWTDESTGTASYGGVVGSGGAVFVVGTGGNILRSTGNGVWTGQTSNTTQDLNGIWASSTGFFYVAGNAGTLLYSNGAGSWQAQNSTTGQNLYCVWGNSDSNVFVGGQGGVMLHSPGGGSTMWTSQTTGFADDFLGLWGTADGANIYGANNSAGAVFYSTGNGSWTFQNTMTVYGSTSATGSGTTVYVAAATTGTLLSSTGGAWSKVNAMVSKQLWGVFALGPGDVWAVGDGGTVTHLSGGTWNAETTGSTASLRAVWSDGTDVYAVGLAGAILHRH